MQTSDKIRVIAEWLENAENEIFQETNEQDLERVAEAFVSAASMLQKVASEIQVAEDDHGFSPETLDEIAAIAEAYDESNDEDLQKQASVFDDLLVSIAAPRDFIFDFDKAREVREDAVKKKYEAIAEEERAHRQTDEALEALSKSEVMKERPMRIYPALSRHCMEHPGEMLARVGDDVYQCPLDGKMFNYMEGFTLVDGTKIPPQSVKFQTPELQDETYQIFDSREDRINSRI